MGQRREKKEKKKKDSPEHVQGSHLYTKTSFALHALVVTFGVMCSTRPRTRRMRRSAPKQSRLLIYGKCERGQSAERKKDQRQKKLCQKYIVKSQTTMCSTLVNKGLRRHNKVRLFLASQIANWW